MYIQIVSTIKNLHLTNTICTLKSPVFKKYTQGYAAMNNMQQFKVILTWSLFQTEIFNFDFKNPRFLPIIL